MDIDVLRSFLAFVETGSYTRAARQVFRTQSAFSAQMHKLEKELGCALFQKQGRNLLLTEAGLALVKDAKQLVSLHDQTLKGFNSYKDKQSLRLGCPEDYNDKLLPQIIRLLLEAKPKLSIQVFNEPSFLLRQKLDRGELDAAIVTRSPDSLEGYWLTSDEGVWIGSVDNQCLQQAILPLALFQADCRYHAAAIDGLQKRGQAFQLVMCANSASAQRAIVRQGLAIGAMGKLSVTEDLVVMDNMPPLPSVDIVMLVGAVPHPLLSPERLQIISEKLSL
ncbi:LysR family transcriptional regulator [Vibrio zhugei]|uniref:LysR family transcriptional regulator n=1 Tax=Vibrio zhugei TaxID=2479546 RepID=A0ABV7C773_9VIBR|nr:LysR family transcriptional regulator [Vibrio zhugei]